MSRDVLFTVLMNGTNPLLNEDVGELRRVIAALQSKVKFYEEENAHLNEIIFLLKLKHFAKKSEAVNSNQLGLFNEAEAGYSKSEEKKTSTAVSITIKSYKRGQPKRRPIPDNLPREEVVVELSEEERVCSEGHELGEIGEEVSEQLDIIPAKIKVIKTIRKKYACKECEGCVKTAPLPPTAIPKSMAAPGLLSFIAVSKYVDALPLYRISEILKRCKIEIPRHTMARWMIKIGNLLQPVWNLLEEELLASAYVCCDETRVQVLKEVGKSAESLSYMWVRSREGPNQTPIVLFDYFPNRSGEVPKKLLEGFEGHLQVDGYEGYNQICRNEKIIRVGCWAHARRKFFEASKASMRGKGKSEEALLKIKKLYQIEERIKNQSIEKRYKIRQEESKPILEEFREWLDKQRDDVPPSSLLGRAMNYALGEWSTLIRYIEDGRLRIDNNYVENAIRPFAIGRKNWLFSDSVAGANASATIYSVLETAKKNGHDPEEYFRYLLIELPKAKTADEIEILLPHNVDLKSKAENSRETSAA